MEPEDVSLEIFLRDRMKDKGISLKKLSDLTGIATNHIENMLRGDFAHVPPTPYFRGYLIRIGEVLNFDGEMWWDRIRKEEDVRKSGPTDALPKNRFTRESPAKIVAIGAIVVVLIVLFCLALPHILGKPVIAILSPQENPYTTSSTSIAIQGTVTNANSLYVNGEEVTIAPDGSWQKNVLLQDGPNFHISAEKFLGGTADVIEQIIYNPSATIPTASSSSPSSTTTTQ